MKFFASFIYSDEIVIWFLSIVLSLVCVRNQSRNKQSKTREIGALRDRKAILGRVPSQEIRNVSKDIIKLSKLWRKIMEWAYQQHEQELSETTVRPRLPGRWPKQWAKSWMSSTIESPTILNAPLSLVTWSRSSTPTYVHFLTLRSQEFVFMSILFFPSTLPCIIIWRKMFSVI